MHSLIHIHYSTAVADTRKGETRVNRPRKRQRRWR
jgi:hypothetical protein